MKMITRRGIFLLILVIAFIGGLVFMTVSLVNDGDSWVMQPYNSSVYYENPSYIYECYKENQML